MLGTVSLQRFIVSALLISILMPVISRADDDQLLGPADATRLGLEQAWRRTLQVGAGVGRLVDIKLHVDGTRAHKYIDVVKRDAAKNDAAKTTGDAKPASDKSAAAANGGEQELLWRMKVDQLDPRTGQALSEAAVRKEAERQLLLLKAGGVIGEIKETLVPQIWLVALGGDGAVQAMNAETGSTVWVRSVAHPLQPKFSLAVNDEYVCFTYGATLVQLETGTGGVVNVEPCKTVPIDGPSICGDFVMFPTAHGGMEGHHLKDITDGAYQLRTLGRAVSQARVFKKSGRMVWPTDRGYVYYIEANREPSELVRLKADGFVDGQLEIVGDDQLFYSSTGGYVYGFQLARNATPLWQVSTGEPMQGDTLVFDGNVYATSQYGKLFAYKAADGKSLWSAPAPRIGQVIGSIGNALITRDIANQLTVLSAITGARAATASGTYIHHAIVNRNTDRIYLVNNRGTVQCLRPIGRELPQLKVAYEFTAPKKSEDKEAKPGQDDENPSATPPNDTDPFGAGNPFEAAAPAMNGEVVDPFAAPAGAGAAAGDAAGAADPFAVPAAGGAVDPFAP